MSKVEEDDDKWSVPKAEAVHMPTPEEWVQLDVMNNCAVRSIFSFVGGGGMGLLMGVFFSSIEPPPYSEEGMSGKQKVVAHFKHMGGRSWSMAKTFAVMGAMFSASECVVEKARAKHDIYNSMYAGCFTGGALSAKAGFKPALYGCAGFAAFSAAIDKFMESRE